ncbi:MAG TPA: bifunctional 5,10-methylenetetrahydrofolate dehydrogenase/5,10-methenyltetrahydrofolate cyclohydrolase [Candidatus Brocadiia bacterium]|nr:bifunctional 5,10-methylenetetrahydrofolate dehydrogenase/5,10-methenyltetrahydrofolate cyclohydrolase [Candidatus Brocadiia bacterium]
MSGLKTGEAQIIDGEAIAAQRTEKLKIEVAELRQKGIVPHLKAVQAGENPASAIYVSNQKKTCEAVGIDYTLIQLPETAARDDIAQKIAELNEDMGTTGVILQMPLPPGVDSREMQALIAPHKDIEGINPANLGRLLANKRDGGPCTAVGAFELLLSTGVELQGKNAVVVGHSEIVGKPMALMLLGANCTTSVCHVFTKDMRPLVKEADILVVAAGKSQALWLRYQKIRKEDPKTPIPDLSPLIPADMIKPGAVVIDIAINRIPKRLKENGRPVKSKKTGKPIMVTMGDVDFEGAKSVASWITPVPGGVGPMTVNMLLTNTVYRCKAQHGLV